MAGFLAAVRSFANQVARFLIAAVVVILATSGTLVAFGPRLQSPDMTGAALLVLAGAVILIYLIQQPWVRVGLVAVSYWIPLAAAAGTVIALFLLPPEARGTRSVAVLVGLIAAACLWLAAAMLAARRSTASTANGRAYAAIAERARSLMARITALEDCEPEDPCENDMCVREAQGHLAYVVRALEADETANVWANGAGYQGLWTAVHRADEALIGCMDAPALRREIMKDLLRLKDSKLERELSGQLKEIRDRIPKKDTPAAEWARRELAGKIQVIRRAINEFQDGRWDGLVNARTALSRSTLITAWTAYAIGALAVTLAATREALAVSAVYFGVGALVGLIAQLRSDARKSQVVEDYGLNATRVHQLVLASGLAGVGGVVLMAIGADVTNTASAGSVELAAVFGVGVKPAPLLVAAVFGLSPSLLLDRISSRADTYREDLSNIQVGTDKEATANSTI